MNVLHSVKAPLSMSLQLFCPNEIYGSKKRCFYAKLLGHPVVGHMRGDGAFRTGPRHLWVNFSFLPGVSCREERHTVDHFGAKLNTRFMRNKV